MPAALSRSGTFVRAGLASPSRVSYKNRHAAGLATEADVTQPTLGSVEWFKHERLHLIEFAKAIDSFGAARCSFQKLIKLGLDGDPNLRASLHTSGVISYARPFVSNTRADGIRAAFPKKVIKKHTNYIEGVHRELIDLRQKLVAHSDRDYVDGRLFRKLLSLEIEQEQTEFLVGATVDVPSYTINPHAVLTMPPLKLGPGGYVFRGFAMQIDLSTEITRTADDGSKAVFRWEVIKDSDSDDAVSNASESPDT
jgi:hypothetical protein